MLLSNPLRKPWKLLLTQRKRLLTHKKPLLTPLPKSLPTRWKLLTLLSTTLLKPSTKLLTMSKLLWKK